MVLEFSIKYKIYCIYTEAFSVEHQLICHNLAKRKRNNISEPSVQECAKVHISGMEIYRYV
jgi:hypothetical protein